MISNFFQSFKQSEPGKVESWAMPTPIDSIPEAIELFRPVVGWGHNKDKTDEKKDEAKEEKSSKSHKSVYHEIKDHELLAMMQVRPLEGLDGDWE